MPQYFFDVKNRARIADTVGLCCRDDLGAIATAKFIATQIAIKTPYFSCERQVIVMNSAGTEIVRQSVPSAAARYARHFVHP